MSKVYIDARPAQLLDKKQRGIGVYTDFLIKNIKKLDKDYINYHYLPLKFEKFIPCYSPEKEMHILARKMQILCWLLDNQMLKYTISSKDIFHSLDQLYIPKTKRYKRIVTVHDLIPLLFPEKYLKNIQTTLRELYLQSLGELSSVDHIITVSECTKKDIVKHCLVDERKVSIIYEAADPMFRIYHDRKHKEMLYKKMSLPANFILYVGGIDPRKNVEGVIKVFRNLVKKYSDLYLVVVGSDFITQKDLSWKGIDLLIKKYSLTDKIIPVGFIDTNLLTSLYNEARMLLFPSFYEGFGLPLVEAMACGCPVISSNRSCIPEIVQDAALLVDPSDITAMTKAAKELLDNTDLSESFKHKGLKRAKDFSWEKTARQTVDVYASLLK